jgi:hypothetical protein
MFHTSALSVPQNLSRKQRRALRHADRRLHAERARQSQAARQAARQAELAERENTILLPAAGEDRPGGMRTPGKFRLPHHQDTTAVLAGAYPFLAEGGLGSEGVFIGQDLYSGGAFVFDPWVLYRRGVITSPNIVLAGIVGSGKSALA